MANDVKRPADPACGARARSLAPRPIGASAAAAGPRSATALASCVPARRVSSDWAKPPVVVITMPGCTAMVLGAWTMLVMYRPTRSKPALVRCRPSGPK